MGIKRAALDCLVFLMKTAIRASTGRNATQIHAHLAEQFSPVVTQNAGAAGTLRFYCPGVLPEYRARTLLTKEPETIEWLNSMGKGEVLWDIGANVGIYSLYAAKRGVTVQAFEPAPGNYYLLHRNIELNRLDNLIDSYCLAFNDDSRLDTFYMSTTDLGGSTSSFGEPTDWKGETYVAKFKQSMIGFTVDGFIPQFAPPRPHHIKIDVDGIEKKIILGARQTLADPQLRSVLVELNTAWADYAEIVGLFASAGLTLRTKSHAAMFDNTELSAVFNHIFVRVGA